jgi:septal ring factor EnvC (AmiA/AmiB activator)
MPQSTPTPPAPPATPQANSLGDAIRDIVGSAVGTALQSTRTELSSKLASLQAQRAGLEQALSTTDSRAARASIQGRIDRVDRDIAETQRTIERINSQIDRQVERQTDVRVSTGTTAPPAFPSRPMDNFDPLPIVATSLGILFVAFPLTLAIVRFIWKRSTSAPAPALSQEQTRRFDRLEQSVDAIAIEVERISENQRYLTKLLAEPRQAAKIEA